MSKYKRKIGFLGQEHWSLRLLKADLPFLSPCPDLPKYRALCPLDTPEGTLHWAPPLSSPHCLPVLVFVNLLEPQGRACGPLSS